MLILTLFLVLAASAAPLSPLPPMSQPLMLPVHHAPITPLPPLSLGAFPASEKEVSLALNEDVCSADQADCRPLMPMVARLKVSLPASAGTPDEIAVGSLTLAAVDAISSGNLDNLVLYRPKNTLMTASEGVRELADVVGRLQDELADARKSLQGTKEAAEENRQASSSEHALLEGKILALDARVGVLKDLWWGSFFLVVAGVFVTAVRAATDRLFPPKDEKQASPAGAPGQGTQALPPSPPPPGHEGTPAEPTRAGSATDLPKPPPERNPISADGGASPGGDEGTPGSSP